MWLLMVTTQKFLPKRWLLHACAMTRITFKSRKKAKTRKIQALKAIYMQRFQWMSAASSDPGSVSRASNSQQAMWETTHQQVSVKSAAGQSGEVFFLRLRPSLPVCLLTVGQCLRFIRRCEALHCPAAPLLKCADELTPSRQIRTCYLKSGLRSLINRPTSLSLYPAA